MLETPPDQSYLVDIDDGLLTLTFNRPENGNTIPTAAIPQLAALFQAAQDDLSIRCILIRGKGRMFSAGGDVAGFVQSLDQDVETRRAEYRTRLQRVEPLVAAVVGFDRPIVACVHGPAAGAGLVYTLAADLVLGDANSTFVFAHQKLGLTPDGGLSYLLPRVVGQRVARTLVLTSAKVEADEALRIGLLSRIVPTEQLADEAMKAARRFVQAPIEAVRRAKTMLMRSLNYDVTEQMRIETEAVVACVGTDDFGEGVRAFLEKRTPRFGN